MYHHLKLKRTPPAIATLKTPSPWILNLLALKVRSSSVDGFIFVVIVNPPWTATPLAEPAQNSSHDALSVTRPMRPKPDGVQRPGLALPSRSPPRKVYSCSENPLSLRKPPSNCPIQPHVFRESRAKGCSTST